MELALVLLITQLVLASVYFVGGVIWNAFSSKKKSSLDLSPVIGLFLVIGTWSLFVTGGVTVHWLFFALAGLAIFYLKKEGFHYVGIKTPSLDSLWPLLVFGLFWSIILGSMYFSYFTNASSVVPPHHDLLFYSKTSDVLFRTGQENPLGVINLSQDVGNVPYHYFELYLLQFFRIGSVTGIMALLTGVPAILLSLISWSLWKNMFEGKKELLPLIISALLPFISGIALPLPLDEVGAFSDNVLVSCTSKNAVITLPFLCAFLSYRANKSLSALFFVWLLPMITLALLPSVIAVTFLVVIYAIFKKKAGAFILLASWVATIVFIGGFYKLTGITGDYGLPAPSFSEVVNDFVQRPFVKLRQYIALHVYYWLDYILYVPVLIFLFREVLKTKLKEYAGLLFFMGAFLSISFFGWVLLFDHNAEAWQVYFYNAAITSNVVLWMAFSSVTNRIDKSKIPISALLIFVGVGCFSYFTSNWSYDKERFEHVGMSKSFYDECLLDLGDEKCLFAYSEYELQKPEVYPVGNIFWLSRNIDIYNIHERILVGDMGGHKQSLFYQEYHNSDNALEEIYSDYMEQVDARYLLTRGEELPDELKRRVRLIRTDSKNGYQFFAVEE